MTDDYHEALRDHRPDRRRAGRGIPHGVASKMNQINGANLLAMRSLAVQARDSAITTAGNMEALIQHYIALQAENVRLQSQCQSMIQELAGRHEAPNVEHDQRPVGRKEE